MTAEQDEGLWIPTDADFEAMTDEELRLYVEIADAFRNAEDEEWVPQPKQALATRLAKRADELLYGGSAGGGKTYWLVNYALEEMLEHPNNYGGIFRRIYKSIVGTVLHEALQIYPRHGGKWNDQKQRWTFPNGSILIMSSIEDERGYLAYQGQQFGFLGFEEVTEFTETQVGYMIGRLRAPAGSIGIRPHMVATANPGGPGHSWVKRRWVKPKPIDLRDGDATPMPFEVWEPRPKDADSGDLGENTRCFVPATLEDNPALQRKDPGYRRRLNQIADKGLREAMKTGDWDAIDAIEGALWAQRDFDSGRVTAAQLQARGISERVVSLDPSDGNEDGSGDSFGVSVCARGLDGAGYVEYTAGWRAKPLEMAKNIVALYHRVGADAIVIEKNHGGVWLPTVLRQIDRYANIQMVWASEGKVTRARPVAALFEPVEDLDGDPYRAHMVGDSQEDFEEQATTYTGQPGESSPNELDAVVWAMSYLLLKNRATGEGTAYGDERLDGRR